MSENVVILDRDTLVQAVMALQQRGEVLAAARLLSGARAGVREHKFVDQGALVLAGIEGDRRVRVRNHPLGGDRDVELVTLTGSPVRLN